MNPMFAEGLNLMVVGMGVVFAFLVLLVGMVSLMSKLVVRFAPEHPPAVPARASTSAQTAVASAGASVDATTLAVIQAAVRQHRDLPR